VVAMPRARPPAPPQEGDERALRCWNCGRLLARIVLLPGCKIEVKCRDCKAINVAEVDKGKATH
jgi:phage FluMu protein Com